MYDFILNHQLNILLATTGACGICAFFVYISKALPQPKKRDLMLLELAATALLVFDRGAMIFDGHPGEVGFWMVRICNLAVYLLTLGNIYFFNRYLKDVVTYNDDNQVVSTKLLRVTEILCLVGMAVVLLAHFTGLFYTFDENNTYQRTSLFFVSYILPMVIPILQISYIIQYYKKINQVVRRSLLLFPLIPMVASLLQFFLYGLMLTDIALSFASVQLYVMALMDTNATLENTRRKEILILTKDEQTIFSLFKQIVTAFVSAIDAKDSYTKGHATRSAGYARKLAELVGKDNEMCEAAYFSALLHDVGKISLPDKLLKKRGNLSEEESKIFDGHVIRGRDILSGITEFPYLQDAAHYHHEWYDGSGFPDGLKGEDIPELARIVTLADAYDAMSSIREDRDPLPQQTIREEIVKESGKRFDPEFAKKMLQMIDEDKEYQLREHREAESEDLETELRCDAYRSRCSKGISIAEETGRITFRYEPTEGDFSAPSLLLYASLDGRIHRNERSITINRYAEYGEIWFDGHMISTRARNMKMNTKEMPAEDAAIYQVHAVRVKDHIRLQLEGGGLFSEVIVALPDSSNSAYLSLTGEHCLLTEIEYDTTGIILNEGDIPRIADEVTYINRMVGDVPNIQVDDYLSAVTEGKTVEEEMEIIFHTMTLPTATLVWHCPSLIFFKSDNHLVNGPNYEELAIIRLDGESFDRGKSTRSITEMRKEDSFDGWDSWKEINKKGYECKVYLRRRNNRILLQTENAGISVKSTIYTESLTEDIQVALTGDRCALTDIRFIA